MINKRLKTITRRNYVRFIKLKGAPREIALGFALGLMIGMTPFLGAHIVFCLMLASLLGWSKIGAMVGVNITNVFTAPLIYPINYWVGYKLAGLSDGIKWPELSGYADVLRLMKQSPLILADLFIGGLILGLPMAVASYFVVLKVIRFYRQRKPIRVNFAQQEKKKCPAENGN
jgi:hypothetical protein